MGDTYWYAYDKTGKPTPPYFDTREEAAENAGDGELVRPVTAAIVEGDTTGDQNEESDEGEGIDESVSLSDEPDNEGPEPYKHLGHDELKQEAEERGIAEETDLRSRESIIEALREFDA